jgi:aryl-alcohol dehydrogenase-like predicted oxidoreductase
MDTLMQIIPTRKLGRTDLHITRFGYGAMELRGSRVWSGREVSAAQAERILDAVLDSGITLIDTSNDYGRSEELIGQCLGVLLGESRHV